MKEVHRHTVWRLMDETRVSPSLYGSAVLVQRVEDAQVVFFPWSGREVPRSLFYSEFKKAFAFCHKDGAVCERCHERPGILKEKWHPSSFYPKGQER